MKKLLMYFNAAVFQLEHTEADFKLFLFFFPIATNSVQAMFVTSLREGNSNQLYSA